MGYNFQQTYSMYLLGIFLSVYSFGWCWNRWVIIYLLKPLPALLLSISRGEDHNVYFWYTIGDILLMLSSGGLDLAMKLGLVSFVLGHLEYRKIREMKACDLLVSFGVVILCIPNVEFMMRLAILFYFTILVSIFIGVLIEPCVDIDVLLGWGLFIFSDLLIVKEIVDGRSPGCTLIIGSYWSALWMISR